MIGATGSLFDLVFVLRRRRRLPLHVVRGIGAAALQWLDVIHNEPWARPRGLAGCWTEIAGLECSSGRRAPRDLSIGSADTRYKSPATKCTSCALDRAFVRPVDRGALRGAERAEPRLAEAHFGTKASRRQSAR